MNIQFMRLSLNPLAETPASPMPAGGRPERLPVIKTMLPRTGGAVKWTRRYGASLVCVRYRTDASGSTRFTTVEVVVDAMPIQKRRPGNPFIMLPGTGWDRATRALAMSGGAVWVPEKRHWRMRQSLARRLGLVAGR
jgi:hypothetical protein